MDGFAAQIKRYRAARRWSQERLAAEAEMDHSLVSRLEAEARKPTTESITKLCAGLELSEGQRDALYLAAGFVPPATNLEALARLVGALRHHDEHTLTIALDLVQQARTAVRWALADETKRAA